MLNIKMGNTSSQDGDPDESAMKNVEKAMAKLMATKAWQSGFADEWLQFTEQHKPSDLEMNRVLLSSIYREDGEIEEPSLFTDAMDRCKNGKGSAKDNDIVIFAWMLTKNPDYFRALETNAVNEPSAEWAAGSLRKQYSQWVPDK